MGRRSEENGCEEEALQTPRARCRIVRGLEP
jgi:hypothetical protein